METVFGLVVIGDEILKGKRRDRHFEAFREMLAERGRSLAWLQVLPDDPDLLTRRLRASMNEDLPVFCCGGIGATPDDHTRRCAALAAGRPLVPHPGAVAEIEGRFGADAYPNRIRMAELPQGCDLIPNPHNRIPGFSMGRHYFLPGFPDMAHPMARWVLDTHFPQALEAERELSIRIQGAHESSLMPLLERLAADWPRFKLFSLPRMAPERTVEVGFRGRGDLETACEDLCRSISAMGLKFERVEPP
jgi:molybdopterin-biosynthesis enzyme MoeA-like protein